MKREELQKMKKLAGLLKEELDVSWNPFEYNYQYQSIQSLIAKKAKEYFKEAGLDPDGKMKFIVECMVEVRTHLLLRKILKQ